MPNFLLAIIIILVIITSLFFLAHLLENMVDEEHLLATPNISKRRATYTAVVTAKIHGTVDEVFKTVLTFGEGASAVPFSDFKWNTVAPDGVPAIGSTGSAQLDVEDFAFKRSVPIKLTMLDRGHRKVAFITDHYPSWLLQSERVQEVLPIEGSPNVSEYRTYLTLTGFASYYLLLTATEEILETQQRCADNLQAFFQRNAKNYRATW